MLEIREAILEDAYRIADIHTKSRREAYKGIISESSLDNNSDINKRAEDWKCRLTESQEGIKTFVAIDGDILAGFTTIGKSRNNKYLEYSELYAIYLDPYYFKKGIGKALFQAGLKYAITNNYKKMFVNVLSDNKIAIDFYLRIGAQVIDNSGEELIINGDTCLEIKYEWKDIKERFLENE